MTLPSSKKLCVRCHERKPLYWSWCKQKMRWDKGHDVCQECYEKAMDKQRRVRA